MRKRTPWWGAVMALLVVLWIGVAIFYKAGSSGVAFGPGGGPISFDRQNDFALFGIDQRAALLVSNDSMSVVAYGRGVFPFCPLCGTYEPRGSIVNLARYYKDGWFYTDHTGGPFAELYHAPTGTKVEVEGPAGRDASTLPAYVQRGLTFDASRQITPSLIRARFEPLRTINESCVVFNSAFLLLAGAWLLVGLVLVIRRRRGPDIGAVDR